ncbi:serine--tRNA ligase [Candidatus Saccharibacteria bacterium]|nr:serine--tRNA ligase [Candidatus Saccharibacteria bacterium]
MLDIKYVRENADKVQKDSENKGCKVNVSEILKLDEARRVLQSEVDDLRQKRNEIAAKMKNGKPEADLIKEGKKVKDRLNELETELAKAEGTFTLEFKKLPNTPHEDVPVGQSESENVVIKTAGKPTSFSFKPKNHWELAQARGWIDKDRAAKVTGARFAYIKGDLVKLWWAMQQFAVDEMTNEKVIEKLIKESGLKISSKPFTPVLPPLMIRTGVYDAMDRLEPREERYKIEGEDLWLQGSAEHVLGSMHAEEILDEKDMPLRYVGFASSFRREAGAAGKDMEGIIRMHQFDKLEMVSLSTKETSLDEHLLAVAIQEHLNKKLGLPYQVIQKCTFDIGKPNARGVDIDTWLPGQNKYRETHTADYMTDYQARRLKTRVRREDSVVELVHNNDATVFAQRSMIAVMENYQNEDATVTIPEALKPYMGGKERI